MTRVLTARAAASDTGSLSDRLSMQPLVDHHPALTVYQIQVCISLTTPSPLLVVAVKQIPIHSPYLTYFTFYFYYLFYLLFVQFVFYNLCYFFYYAYLYFYFLYNLYFIFCAIFFYYVYLYFIFCCCLYATLSCMCSL